MDGAVVCRELERLLLTNGSGNCQRWCRDQLKRPCRSNLLQGGLRSILVLTLIDDALLTSMAMDQVVLRSYWGVGLWGLGSLTADVTWRANVNAITAPVGIDTEVDTRVSLHEFSSYLGITRSSPVADFLRNIIRVDRRHDNTVGVVPRK